MIYTDIDIDGGSAGGDVVDGCQGCVVMLITGGTLKLLVSVVLSRMGLLWKVIRGDSCRAGDAETMWFS
jgi:hypothetical protein